MLLGSLDHLRLTSRGSLQIGMHVGTRLSTAIGTANHSRLTDMQAVRTGGRPNTCYASRHRCCSWQWKRRFAGKRSSSSPQAMHEAQAAS
jgi:hypothetical protein